MKSIFFFILLSHSIFASIPDNKVGEKLFSLQVHNILESKCFSCHSQDNGKTVGDLDLSSRKRMLRGGETSEGS